VVARQHLSDEQLHPPPAGGLGELAEQDGAQPAPLELVVDHQRDLGTLRMVAFPLPAGMGHDTTPRSGHRDQPVLALMVDDGGPVHHQRHVHRC
jgi:hypothetical protein